MQPIKILLVLSAGNVKEEGEGVLLHLAALIALEGIVVPVVVHVKAVHQLILERDAAKFTGGGGELGWPGRNGYKAGHSVGAAAVVVVVGILLRVCSTFDLVGLTFPSVLACGAGEGGTGGVAAGVAARVNVGGAAVGAATHHGLLAEIQGTVRGLSLLRSLAHPAGVQR